jgi:hypothetical protein
MGDGAAGDDGRPADAAVPGRPGQIDKAKALLYVNGKVGMKSPGYQAYLARAEAAGQGAASQE